MRIAQDNATYRLCSASDLEGFDHHPITHRNWAVGAIRELVCPDLARILMQHGMEGIGQSSWINFDFDVGADPARHRRVADDRTGLTGSIGMNDDPPWPTRRQTRNIDRVVDDGLIHGKDVWRELGEHSWRNAQ